MEAINATCFRGRLDLCLRCCFCSYLVDLHLKYRDERRLDAVCTKLWSKRQYDGNNLRYIRGVQLVSVASLPPVRASTELSRMTMPNQRRIWKFSILILILLSVKDAPFMVRDQNVIDD